MLNIFDILFSFVIINICKCMYIVHGQLAVTENSILVVVILYRLVKDYVATTIHYFIHVLSDSCVWP